MTRPGLSALIQAGFQARQQPFRQRAGRGSIGRDHGGRNLLGRKKIAGCYRAFARTGRMDAERTAAGIGCRPARRVHDGELAVGNEAAGCNERGAHLFGIEASRQEIEADLTQLGIGDVLAGDRADQGPGMHAPRRNRGRGGGDRDPEHAGFGAASGQGKSHAASISTSHSERASADTTSPVDTGNTPLSHLPTVR